MEWNEQNRANLSLIMFSSTVEYVSGRIKINKRRRFSERQGFHERLQQNIERRRQDASTGGLCRRGETGGGQKKKKKSTVPDRSWVHVAQRTKISF